MSLFVRMVKEEWRLHSRLFGSKRFALFPLFIALVCGVSYWFLTLTGTTLDGIALGLHAVVFFLGLQVGTIGFVGRDALKNLLGDLTLLVFSARTLPLSQRRLLATFLVKDLVYYAFLYLAPVVLAYAPFALQVGHSPLRVLLLWVTVAEVFGIGVALSFAAAAVATRGRAALGLFLLTVGALVVYAQAPLQTIFSLGLSERATLLGAGIGVVVLIALSAFGLVLFKPRAGSTHRTPSTRLAGLKNRIPGRDPHLVARAVTDVGRSSGSFWKVVISAAVIFGTTAFLLDKVAEATAIRPGAGIALGTLLGLGSFTTYAWVTQFDDAREYLHYPITLTRVFRAKFYAYLLLTIPVSLCFLLIAELGFNVTSVLSGFVIFPLVSVYVFGVTAWLTGLAPNDLLFDTPRFVLFGVAIALVAVPLLVASLAHSVSPLLTTGIAVVLAALAAVLGWVLLNRAGPRWDVRLRQDA
ncbi:MULTISPECIES: hypothetical protein [unclassified Haladaptatus]|uniref:hypothetical protein n=1 Tax=unclassified Haladaptatus TaxID=2622732 RepID=UPI0023E8D194|nr:MULTISPECIES: hypothetical protein [unclassified Haladaptatus]